LVSDQKNSLKELNKIITTLNQSLQRGQSINLKNINIAEDSENLTLKVSVVSELVDSLLAVFSVVEDENNYYRSEL